MSQVVKFKTKRGRRVRFTAHKRSHTKVAASRRARGKSLARKYGFVSRKGKVYRKVPGHGLRLVHN